MIFNHALHKVSKKLVENYDLISVEDLNVKGMIKNHKLSKHTKRRFENIWAGTVHYKGGE